jgi:tetratricopeptide (TPR) repeat protein
MNHSGHVNLNNKAVSRREFLLILQTALETQSFRFARLAALNWLAIFPGDLRVNLYLGESQLGEGKTAQAIQIFEKIVALDPEFIEVREALVKAYRAANHSQLPAALASYYVLGGNVQWNNLVFEWGANLFAARKALENKDAALAERLVTQVMAAQPDLSLAAVTHLHIASIHHQESVYQLAASYHTRWPECLQIKLYLAEAEIDRGNEAQAVSLLHQCVASDAAAQVVYRLWGNDHRYLPLWPDALEIYLDLPIPAAVAAKLGRNQLAAGQVVAYPSVQDSGSSSPEPSVPELQGSPPIEAAQAEVPIGIVDRDAEKKARQISPETILSVEETFGKLAKRMKKPALGRADGRCPVYVILSTRTGLEALYGRQTSAELISLMSQLGAILNRRTGWGGLVFLPDDVDSAAIHGLKAMDAVDPWKIKLALADLDKALTKKGQMIGALLIAGGPDVVPFHRLPNPTDDADRDVPSDNPYGTLDSNYFVPEWPVGRLVGEASADSGLIIEQLRSVISYHNRAAKTGPAFASILAWLLTFLRSRSAARKEAGFGYTAEVWRQSSAAVYRSMGGDAAKLLSCPPEESNTVPSDKISSAELEYFNLHGIEDGADWYGQKDVNSTSNGPDYPVAIGPRNLSKNGHSPVLVFTEACYGANIINKKESEAMALKFLAIGARGVIGSTTISYGSVAEPLIGADLLGSLFWRGLKDGLTAGESLLQARVGVVREMTQRQGFLDGEDQKTLISFVHLGDPLFGYEASQNLKKSPVRLREHAKVKMICDRSETDQGMQPISAKVLNEVKEAVAEYLPGLGVSEIVISRQREACSGAHHHCLTTEVHEKTPAAVKDGSVVVTISKKVLEAQHIHIKYARVTLNAKGKMVKLAVSR